VTKRLIINADDYNLTGGVSRGILKAYDQGVVTSTTVMINLPLDARAVKELRKRPGLGAGLHLNVTLGEPVSHRSQVRTLLQPDGKFRRPAEYLQRAPSEGEIAREYEAQVGLFVKCFERKPDHLDTHHHLHDFLPFFRALARVARRWKIPVRRSRIFQLGHYRQEVSVLRTTDYLFGNLEARHIWRRDSFWGVAENLPDGTSEIGCHPAFCDRQLREISSFRELREEELRLFSDRHLRREITSLGVELINFSHI
jgi:predicted glycoside hydrolase/deacetylase ChbG (UPF0249 family)